MGTGKSQPEGPPFSGKLGLPSFPLNGGPEVFFLEPLKSNDGLFFSTYRILFVDDVTEFRFTINDARCTKSA